MVRHRGQEMGLLNPCMYELTEPLSIKVNEETLEMLPGKWGLCRDERTVILDNEAKGFYCPIPFAYNGRYYDSCTRLPSPQLALADPNSLEERYWCAPGDIHSDGDVSTQAGLGGLCDEYLYPESMTHKRFPICEVGFSLYFPR